MSAAHVTPGKIEITGPPPDLYFPDLQHVLADAWVVRSSDLGSDEENVHVRTHLGHLLQPGDTALG